jgi:hypothetical protein
MTRPKKPVVEDWYFVHDSDPDKISPATPIRLHFQRHVPGDTRWRPGGNTYLGAGGRGVGPSVDCGDGGFGEAFLVGTNAAEHVESERRSWGDRVERRETKRRLRTPPGASPTSVREVFSCVDAAAGPGAKTQA